MDAICEMSNPEVQHMEQDVGTAQAPKGFSSRWDEKWTKKHQTKQVALGR